MAGVSSGTEIRGMAAADVDFDGQIEIFCATTDDEIQTFAFKPNGATLSGWPRYKKDHGVLGDADPNNGDYDGRNGLGHYRYGGYGFNVGLGNIDDDVFLEVITTYDDHQIQAFKHTGIALNAAPSFRNPHSQGKGNPLTWGQATARWTNRTTDERHYLQPDGKTLCWPFVGPANDPCYKASPCVAGGDEWLQFTQVPPTIVDLDMDGKSEVATVPNSEKGFNDNCAYPTTQRVLFVLDGAHGNLGDPQSVAATRSALRHTGFDGVWPPKGRNVVCQDCTVHTKSCTCRKDSWYPPEGIPSIAVGNIDTTSDTPELVFSFGDGTMSAFSATGSQLWMYDFAGHAGIDVQSRGLECSEPVLADLNRDGNPEVLFNVYGYPTNPPSSVNNQRLMILNGKTGQLIHEVLTNTAAASGGDTSYNGNGNGAAAAPTVADVDGDGTLEILIHTFDGRMLVYNVPGSATNCIPWPTSRGGYLRKGQTDYSVNA
jgi:hypothetical protein